MGRFDKWRAHCSSLGAITTKPLSGPRDGLSETCKTALLNIWIKDRYEREDNISNKYMEKGLQMEEEGITLLSKLRKKFLRKNQETRFNEFIEGTCDVPEADRVTDIKCSWDIFTFYAVLNKAINKNYDWQLEGYMELWDKPHGSLLYCLVDTPAPIVAKEKKRILWDFGDIDPDTDENYLAACAAIDKSMTYGDIPEKDRYIEFLLTRNKKRLEEVAYPKIIKCREFLNELDEKPHKVETKTAAKEEV